MHVLLPLMILLPLVTALLLLLARSRDGAASRWIAFLGSLATLGISLVVARQYRQLTPDVSGIGAVRPLVELKYNWLTLGGGENFRLEFFLGLDGVSLLLVMLTALLTVVSVLYCWGRPRDRATEFYAMLLVLESALLGAFCAFDLILFYILFEFTIIPLYFLIGIWGGPDRRRAARRFFIYTLAGSLVTLVGLVALAMYAANSPGIATPFSIPALSAALAEAPLPLSIQIGLFLAIAFGFAVKMPLVPLHTWQPLTYVEAPTAVTVLLAGVVMKLGTYGLYRIGLPLLPDAVEAIGVPLIATLSIIGILYGALAALVQRDLKRLIAYSSISHIGFCTIGLFALNAEGISGGVLQMINHGISTSALFLMIGMIYDRYRTRQLTRLGGMAQRIPKLTACLVFVCFASMGLPGLNGFVGEFLSLVGMFAVHPWYASLATIGVVLGAWYLLWMLQQGFFGPLREPGGRGDIPDLQPREAALLAPLLALCLALGVFPQAVLNVIEPDVERLAKIYQTSDSPTGSAIATAQSE